MAITRTPIIDDDGTGTTGTVINNAWKQELYDQIDAADAAAAWITIPYSAADFTASGSMTWTVDAGDVVVLRYLTIGKLATLLVDLSNTTVGGTPSTHLDFHLPVALTPATNLPLMLWVQNPSGAIGMANIVVSGRVLQFYRDTSFTANWTVGTARIAGSLTFAIA